MSPAAMALFVVAGHMFGGMRSPTRNIEAATVAVIGSVVKTVPGPDASLVHTVAVRSVPCARTGGLPSRIEVHELGDHQAGYAAGEVVVLPLQPAGQSPHRPGSVAATAWSVEQASGEVVRLSPGEVAAAEEAITLLCQRSSSETERIAKRVRILGSKVARLAGGAARDLLEIAVMPAPAEETALTLARLMQDRDRPTSLRIADVQIAARMLDEMLKQAVAERIAPDEDPDVVAAALRALSSRPDLVGARLGAVLDGKGGAGRVAAARYAGLHRVKEASGHLERLAREGDTQERAAACSALKAMGTDETRAAMAKVGCPAR